MLIYDERARAFLPGALPPDGAKITALYGRLSQEDEPAGDSGGITNHSVPYLAERNVPHLSGVPVRLATNCGKALRTILAQIMKSWFSAHKDAFVLGLSLDGTPDTHNYNRSNSYDKIDIDFFKNTWPIQGVKMTISEYTLKDLADNVIYIHNLGFKEIDGVNLFEGEFDWGDEQFIRMIIPQLKKLVDFYVEHDDLMVDQMLGRRIDMCEEPDRPKRKWCGIGTGTIFFDTDGTRRPCPFITPMTFSTEELNDIMTTDFENQAVFVDEECFSDCYIYPVCPMCPGANYLVKKHSLKETKRSAECRN